MAAAGRAVDGTCSTLRVDARRCRSYDQKRAGSAPGRRANDFGRRRGSRHGQGLRGTAGACERLAAGLLQFLQWLIIPVVVAVIATAPEVEKGSGGSTCKDMDVLANKLIALMYVAALVGGLAWGESLRCGTTRVCSDLRSTPRRLVRPATLSLRCSSRTSSSCRWSGLDSAVSAE